MFVPETDETNLVWHGPGSGPATAVDIFRADRAFKSSELKIFLGKAMFLYFVRVAKAKRFSLTSLYVHFYDYPCS